MEDDSDIQYTAAEPTNELENLRFVTDWRDILLWFLRRVYITLFAERVDMRHE